MLKSNSEPKTFTLIELLVTISVIIILLSLLLPALRSTKEKALQITCSNQMKQISVGTFSYINDYNAYFPCTKSGVSYAERLIGSSDYVGGHNPVSGYFSGIWVCPKHERPNKNRDSYGFNGFLNWDGYLTPSLVAYKITAVKKSPGSVPMILEEVDDQIAVIRTSASLEGTNYCTDYPHPQLIRTNVIFVDGHYEEKSQSEWNQLGYTILKWKD